MLIGPGLCTTGPPRSPPQGHGGGSAPGIAQDILPDDAGEVFDDLKAAGYIWIGYTLNEPYEWSNPLQRSIQAVFPRQVSFSCQRQKHIFINPFGNPVSAKSWHEKRGNIKSLITIGGDEDVELF